MILVTRLNGTRFALNADLIERVEETPDTVLVLIDGTKYVVSESVDDIVERVIEFRTRVVTAATVEAPEPDKRLRVVPGSVDDA
ncbi:MAG: flagellar FlbD family protein [Acidimicrobiales bacterium]